MSGKENMPSLKEYIPNRGPLHYEDMPEYILCKPKLMPLKSVTLEKLENMQKEAEEKLKKRMNEQRS
jgi:BBSome-interacting protein 1